MTKTLTFALTLSAMNVAAAHAACSSSFLIENVKVLSQTCFEYSNIGVIEYADEALIRRYGRDGLAFELRDSKEASFEACEEAGNALKIDEVVALEVSCFAGEELITRVRY